MKHGPFPPLLALQLVVCRLCFCAVLALPLDSKHAQFAVNSDYKETSKPDGINNKVAIGDFLAKESPLDFSGHGDEAGELFDKRQSFNPWGGKRSALADELMKRSFSPWGGKRGFNPWGGKRSFSPWGGKRSADGTENEEEEEEKRGFNPWGGKRSFSPWGGKRSEQPSEIVDSDQGDKRSFSPWGGKRSFSPWGGKRSEVEEVKKSFSPWGGKRDAEKRGFNPWGGKRSEGDDKRGFNPWGGKRAFNPWGGKRSLEVSPVSQEGHHIVKRSADLGLLDKYSKKDILLAYALLDELQRLQENKEEKRSFSPWGGKRQFNPWGGKRAFNPWGGKRAFNPWGGKRAFSPWGGKRSVDTEDQEEYLIEEEEPEGQLSGPQRFVRETNRQLDQETADDTNSM